MTSPQQASSYLDRIAQLEAENELLRKALVLWRAAYVTGRNEPLVETYEATASIALGEDND